MKNSKYRTSSFCAVLLAIACSSAFGPAAQAQIITSPSFNRLVYAEYTANPGSTTVSQNLSITAIPTQQTISANDVLGGQITTTYSMTDNGSVAQINIASSGSVTTDNTLFEGGGGMKNNSFLLSQAVNYSATVTESGPGASGLTLSGESSGTVNLQLFVDGITGSTETFSGVTGPGLLVFAEDWGLVSNGPNPPPYLSGGSTVSITFTAIPEPSSAALIAIPAVFFLARRRRALLVMCSDDRVRFARR